MILFVSYKQPAGAIWLSFYFMAYVPNIYISKSDILYWRKTIKVEAPWTLVLCRWNDGDHAMMHKMEIEFVKDHIISHYICM
jgi:hypothetical protein